MYYIFCVWELYDVNIVISIWESQTKKLLTVDGYSPMHGDIKFDISISIIGFKYVQRISLCTGYFIRFSLNLSLKLWLMRRKFMNP